MLVTDAELLIIKLKLISHCLSCQIGKEMNAKLILLTHFSGRYKMIPLPDDEELLSNVGLAFDFATFNFLRY